MEDYFLVNEAKVVSQTLEGEAIVINLEKGNYYSFNVTGSEIWDSIIAGHSLRTIEQCISDRYNVSLEQAEEEVRAFVTSLEQEDLVTRTEKGETAHSAPTVTKATEQFVRPSFERYDDMQEMLLADPIHDVGETGWPVLKKEEVV